MSTAANAAPAYFSLRLAMFKLRAGWADVPAIPFDSAADSTPAPPR